MDSPKSLKVITGIFLLFLGVLAFNTIDSIYIPLKKSIAAEHISAIVFYGTESWYSLPLDFPSTN